MNRRLLDALALGAAVAVAGWAFSRWQGALRTTVLLAVVVACIARWFPRLGVAILDRIIDAARAFHWRKEQGRHHAFGGVPLNIDDDGRYVWVAGADLQRVLGSHDPEPALAARHAGRWRRNDDGELLLRVDAVVEVLNTGPGRFDPRILKLRHYFERQVLFPAAERRRRARGS